MNAVTWLDKFKAFLKPNAQDIASMDDNEYCRRFGSFYSHQISNGETVDAQELSEAEYDLRFSKFYPDAETEDDETYIPITRHTNSVRARRHGDYRIIHSHRLFE